MSNVALPLKLINITNDDWRGPGTGEETTMLKKVVYVAVLVSDQDNALDFYTNVIGLEKGVTTRHPTDRDS